MIGLQTKESWSSKNCGKMVKEYIRNTLKNEVDDNDFNRTHRIVQNYQSDDGKDHQNSNSSSQEQKL